MSEETDARWGICRRESGVHLRAALDSRTVIGQATGLLMALFEIDAAEAFQYLRRRSMHEKRELIDIATEIVDARQPPSRPR